MTAQGASQQLKTMNDKWYTASGGGGARRQTKPVGADLKAIEDAISRINTHLGEVLAFPDSNTKKQASLTSIKDSLRHAEICQRLAGLVEADRCDV